MTGITNYIILYLTINFHFIFIRSEKREFVFLRNNFIFSFHWQYSFYKSTANFISIIKSSYFKYINNSYKFEPYVLIVLYTIIFFFFSSFI